MLTFETTQIHAFEPLILLSASATDGNDLLFDIEEGPFVAGGDGHDILIAFVGDAQLYGNDQHDTFVSIRGTNFIDGGDGLDKLIYFNERAEYSFALRPDGGIQISHGNGFWLDTVINVETVQFDNGEYSIDELLEAQNPPSFDGTGNNIANPDWGSTDEQLIRMTSVKYGDGVSLPAGDDRPSARSVSNEMADQKTTSANDRNMSDMVWLWGQFLDHDLSLSEPIEPHEEFPIEVPSGDHLFDPDYTGDKTINLNRSVYDLETGTDDGNPRQQINQITAFIDGGMVYGSDQVRADELREFAGGRLKLTDQNLMPFNESSLPNADDGPNPKLFLAGDVRANENIALTSMHTLWVREHNRIATELANEDPTLTDEQLYQGARKLVTAQIQSITYNEFLPAVMGDAFLPEYSGYDESINPGIASEFSTAAYRFGHSMLSDELKRLNNDGTEADEGSISLKDAFFAPQQVLAHGIDSTLAGAASQKANEVDNQVVDGVRNFLFGPPGSDGLDLASLNIQRGRDHGLADYNTVREELGLARVTEFSEITSDIEVQENLRKTYGHVDNIDLWVGGLAEDHVGDGSVGETFRAIFADQFYRLREGDRFWYERILDSETLAEVESTTLADVIERNTSLDSLQDDVFFA